MTAYLCGVYDAQSVFRVYIYTKEATKIVYD